jgi:SAM-dependent methyltransferase
LWQSLGKATAVLNVGAGTGSYEPPTHHVVALEPSRVMRTQRPPSSATCLSGAAEELPFPDSSFDVVMSVFSHWHWRDQAKGFAEMRRVARRRVLVLTMNITMADRFWLTREYLPSAHQLWGPYEATLEQIRPSRIVEIPIPGDCIDGFFHAYWRRPYAYLDEGVRESMAVFARLGPEEAREGLARLADDLNSGAWQRRHAELLGQPSLDLGCRLLVHERERGADW